MNSEKFKRRLTAIFSADVEGYSRLMRDDEDATIRTITDYRSAISKLVSKYRGRVVDSPGDNILAEFGSVLDAASCAVEVQAELAERNETLPNNRKMRFRIGVNLGDVVEEGERIYGDGVNIAARIEGLADGGGVSISGTVYDSIEGKLGLEFEFLGEHDVKNINKPIRVYRVLSFSDAAAHRVVRAKKATKKKWSRVISVLIAAFVVMAVAVLIWDKYFRLPQIDRIEKQLPELADGPAIAVLPFANTNKNPEDDYICDGITENIIGGLSRCPHLLVISSNSAFTYKGKPVRIREVGHELGVKYVVEGSVQLGKENVRINVQIINATNDHHVWAKKYDRKLDDIFALQDEITLDIILAFQTKLTYGDQIRYRKTASASLDAYLKTLKALEFLRKHNKEANALARHELEEVVKIDPNYSVAYMLLGTTHIFDILMGSNTSSIISFAKANNALKKSLELDNENSYAYIGIGLLYLMRRQHEDAIAAEEKAILLNPNSADAYCELGFVLNMSGRPNESIELVKKALQLNPKPPAYYYFVLGHSYRAAGKHEKAIKSYKKSIAIESDAVFAHTGLAVSYMKLGRKQDAAAEVEEVLRIDPKFSLDKFEKAVPHIDPAFARDMVMELRKAGLK